MVWYLILIENLKSTTNSFRQPSGQPLRTVKADKLRVGRWKQEKETFNFLESNWVNRANQNINLITGVENTRECYLYQKTLLFISSRTFTLPYLCSLTMVCREIFHIFAQELKERKKFPVRFLMVVFGSFWNHLMWVYHQIIIPCCDFPTSSPFPPVFPYPTLRLTLLQK